MGPSIRTVLAVAHLPGGQKMSAVEFCDGRLGICVDGQVDEERIWNARGLNRCIETFIAASRQPRLVATEGREGASGAVRGPRRFTLEAVDGAGRAANRD